MRILIVEDDAELGESVALGLREHGYAVDLEVDGLAGLELARGASYQVIVLDRMLPGLDGLSVVRRLRGAGVETPVIYLTSMSGIDDRVHGLDAGGDDYLVKPFDFTELLARVRALARRPPAGQSVPLRLSCAGLELDLLGRSVTRDGRPLELLPQEFRLLEYLVRNANRVVTRAMLLENVWDIHFDPQTSVVESHVSRLRSKLNRAGDTDLIQTVRGVGYKLLAAN